MIGAIFKLVIGFALLVFPPVTKIHLDTVFGQLRGLTPERIEDGAIYHNNVPHVVYETETWFYIIPIALILWALVDIGVKLYEKHYKTTT